MIDEIQRTERANRLQKLIKSLKLKGNTFAKSIGISQGSISNLLNGKRSITLEFVEKIAERHSNVNVAWILFGEGEMFLKDKPVLNPSDQAAKPTDLSVVSHNIIAIRHRWKRDQTEFGVLLGGYTRNQVSNWERGRTECEYDALSRLEALSGIPQRKIRTQEISRSEIPERPNPSPALLPSALPSTLPSIDEVMVLQQEILQRVGKIEEILRSIQEQGLIAKE